MTTPNLAAHSKGVALYGWTGTEFLPVSIDSSGNLVVGATLSLSGDINVDTKALANAAAPALVEGTQNFFSADLAGNLRVKDAAAGTVLASILAKLLAAPATEAKQDTTNSKLDVLHVDLATTLAAYVDGLETLVGTTNSGLTTLNAKDFATQTTLAAVLAKLIAAPATEAKQDAAIVQETASAAILGVAADAASTTTTIKAALRGIATALGITALDLGSGTGGSRTLRWFQDTAQWIGGAGAVTAAVQRMTLASDDPAVALLGGTGAIKDNGPNWTSAWGVSSAPVASADMSSAANVTDAPTSGQKICIDDIFLTNRTTGALECTLKCETTAAILIGPLQVPANASVQFTPRGKLKLATADKKVTATWSAAGNVNVLVGFHSEA